VFQTRRGLVAAAVTCAAAWAFAAPAAGSLERRSGGAASPPPAALRAVEILSPAPGERIRAGSDLEIRWQFSSAVPPHGLEEWEAFLSLDGGKSYPLRITPHLDLGVRSFSWRVAPGLQGGAQLLLRFGDERREWTLDPARSFDIEAGDEERHAANHLWSHPSSGPGEPARPGDRGVIWWQDGARDGSHLVEHTASRARPPTWQGSITAHLAYPPLAPPSSPLALPGPGSRASLDGAPFLLPRVTRPATSGPSIRLRIHRFNE
jgi:hypothetical protein